MPNPYPNADYPTAWDEANMVKSGAAPVNVAGTGLTVTDVAVGNGPLMDMEAVTGKNVDGVSLRGNSVTPVETTEDE